MSRSYKKFGIIKDKGLTRREYNRRFRRANRQRIKQGKDPKLMNEIIDTYDVCDFKIYWNKRNSCDNSLKIFYTPAEIAKIKREYFTK